MKYRAIINHANILIGLMISNAEEKQVMVTYYFRPVGNIFQ